jgi:hypothetical protein
LAVLLEHRNSRAIRTVHNDEAEEAEGVEEDHMLDLRIDKTSLGIEDGAEANHNMAVAGADEVREKAQAIVEAMLRIRARRL